MFIYTVVLNNSLQIEYEVDYKVTLDSAVLKDNTVILIWAQSFPCAGSKSSSWGQK